MSNSTFDKIVNMLEQMSQCLVGDDWKPLRMTLRLVRLGENNPTLARKHVERFEQFCRANKDAIMENVAAKLTEGVLFYSDGVFVDFGRAFVELEDIEPLWQHLVIIAMDYDSAFTNTDLINAMKSKLNTDDFDGMINKSLELVDGLMKNSGGGENMDFNAILKAALESDMFKELSKTMQGMLQGMNNNEIVDKKPE